MGTETAKERFWNKVDVRGRDGCWLWSGTRTRDGYGSFWGGEWRKNRKHSPIMVLAHRWSYQQEIGEIPDGICVLHRCDEPSCVRPSHLFLGTQADNVADCVTKERRNQSRYRKLSPKLHEQIADEYLSEKVSLAALGRRYGVTYQTIRYIVKKIEMAR